MFLVIARASTPDTVVWPGRRWLACLDALAWPVLAAACVARAPFPVGVAGIVALSLAGPLALRRLHRAWWRNERYRFTTWAWLRWGATLLGLGALLRISLLAT